MRLVGGSRVGEEDREEQNDNPDPMGAITRLGEQFKVPLQSAGVDLDVLTEVFKKNAIIMPPPPTPQPISLSSMDYLAVWWRLFHSLSASECSDILTLVQLIFTLPVPNRKLERIFSMLKTIKVDKRTSLSTGTFKCRQDSFGRFQP